MRLKGVYMKSSDIGKNLADKTFQELGFNPKTKTWDNGKQRERLPSFRTPFRIPAIEKTQRQWTSDQGYKASAAWQTASLLRDLTLLWTTEELDTYSRTFPYPPVTSRTSPVNPGTIRRLRTQMDDAARSLVSTFEEGWARPSTKEYLDFIGFSQASLVELHGDFERCMTDGLIKTEREITESYGNIRETRGTNAQVLGSPMIRAEIPTPSRKFPYPPVASRKFPSTYGKLQERLREYTGKEIQAKDFSYELFMELTNKVSFLFRRTVEGLWHKLSADEQAKLKEELANLRSRYW